MIILIYSIGRKDGENSTLSLHVFDVFLHIVKRKEGLFKHGNLFKFSKI